MYFTLLAQSNYTYSAIHLLTPGLRIYSNIPIKSDKIEDTLYEDQYTVSCMKIYRSVFFYAHLERKWLLLSEEMYVCNESCMCKWQCMIHTQDKKILDFYGTPMVHERV